MGVGQVGYVVGVFDYCQLYVQVDIQIWYFVFSGVVNCCDFVFGVLVVEVVGYQNGVYFVQFGGVVMFDVFGVDIMDVDFCSGGDVGVY